MKIFISWSGEQSHKCAKVLGEWLPNVIQAIKPFVSSEDIEKGINWFDAVLKNLTDAKVGIICITPENMKTPWLLFEAGALAKTLDKTRVCPFLFNVESSDLEPPFSLLQYTASNKKDIFKLLKTINNQLENDKQLSESSLKKTYEKWWPDLETELKRIPRKMVRKSKRNQNEILYEILEICRSIQRILPFIKYSSNEYNNIISESVGKLLLAYGSAKNKDTFSLRQLFDIQDEKSDEPRA